MMAAASLMRLWRGEMPLAIAFWRYLMAYGFALNLGASLAAMTMFLAALPTAWALIIHLAPVPYNAVAAMGVWRSAEREKKSAFAGVAKLAAACLFLVFLLI
jgi:hypothetical protein